MYRQAILTLLLAFSVALIYAELEQNDPYRPQYHVLPPSNWLNDPNGPMYYKGYYHLFYQYTPAPEDGLKYWAHAVSKDMAFWQHLPIALSPSKPYDIGGIFSGSAVILDDGTPMIVYTGQTDVEQQCVAFPNNTNDPLLIDWYKPTYNPIVPRPPPQGNKYSFRDPVTPFKTGNTWHLVTGCEFNNIGAALLFTSQDLKTWTFSNVLYSTDTFGQVWECPDLFRAPDRPANHVFKLSNDSKDWWAVGTYSVNTKTWTPLPGAPFVLADAGRYYASKNFYDPIKDRQINWGWVSEEDSNGPKRGWQGMLTFPCMVTIDPVNLIPLTKPIEEVSMLQGPQLFTGQYTIVANQDKILQANGNQLMLEATFYVPTGATLGLKVLQGSSSVYTSIVFTRSSSTRGHLYVDRSNSGSTGSRDQQGALFPMDPSEETITLVVMVDHSIVEAFEGKGRMRVTSRLYTAANALGTSAFSNSSTTALITAWPMNSIWKNNIQIEQ